MFLCVEVGIVYGICLWHYWKHLRFVAMEKFWFLRFVLALLEEKMFYWWTKLNIVTRIIIFQLYIKINEVRKFGNTLFEGENEKLHLVYLSSGCGLIAQIVWCYLVLWNCFYFCITTKVQLMCPLIKAWVTANVL